MRWKRFLKRIALAAVLLVAALSAVAYWRSTNECYDGGLPVPRDPMKAAIYCDYGSPDVVRIESVERPQPADNQVLVKVRAVSINPLDWHFVRGAPYVMRLGVGLRRPKAIRFGVDFAGVVAAVGKSVTRFQAGDEVFGGRDGAFAEYIAVREEGSLAKKPSNLTFEQAASIPIAAITALQGLRDKAKLEQGQKVLINGASGGVGTFAVQIAKALGAEVTGVCSARNLELVRSLGADRVIDYTKDDFARGEERYDAILDNVGNRSLSECRGVLKAGGIYVLVGGGGVGDQGFLGPLLSPVKMFVSSPFVKQRMGMFIAQLNAPDLEILAGMMETGTVAPVLDRTYPFTEIRAALAYLEEGHARGKVVITVAGE